MHVHLTSKKVGWRIAQLLKCVLKIAVKIYHLDFLSGYNPPLVTLKVIDLNVSSTTSHNPSHFLLIATTV